MCVAMLLGLVMEMLPARMSRAYSPFEIVWMRYGTHLALMVLIWAPREPGRLVRTTRVGWHVIRALTMLGMPVAFVLAVTRFPKDTVLALYWIEPLLAMLLAAVWLRERVERRQWVGGAAAYVGALILFRPTALPGATCAILALSTAACFALYQVFTRFMREETTTARLFHTALWVWLPLSLALPWFWTTPAPADLALMMSIGVLGYLVLLNIDRALDAAPVSRLAPFALAQPVSGVIVDAALRGKAPTLATIAAITIVAGAWVAFVWPAAAGSDR